jgi:hypothetical protein
MTFANRVGLGLAASFSLGMMCGSPGPPPPDSCPSPSSAALTTLELGPEVISDRAYEPWAGSDTAYVTTGVQGGYMLGVTLRVPAGAAACLAQRTTASAGGRVIMAEDSPLKTYEQADGTRTTRTTWLVFPGAPPAIDSQVEVTTKAGGQTQTVQLTIARDRHRLESLTVRTTAPTVGYLVEVELRSRIAPEYDGLQVTVTSTNPDVVSVVSPPYVYGEAYTITGDALSAGETEIVVQFRDQELRVPVVVTE